MIESGFKSRFRFDGAIPFARYTSRRYDCISSVIAHQHKEVEIIAMQEGATDFYIGSARYELKAGDVLVIPPYCMHRAQVFPNTLYQCICFDLTLLWDEEVRKGLEKGALTIERPLAVGQPYTADINKRVVDTVRAYNERVLGWEMEVIGNLSIVFSHLKRISFFVKSGAIDTECLFGKNVLEYVKEHFFEPITSRTVAEVLYLNNSYFCRLFKKNFGCCFADYLVEYRIEEAKFLLKNGSNSISEIALKTGFNSFSYFSKAFKELTGISPSKYRKTHGEGSTG